VEVREFLRRFLGDIPFVFSPFSRRISPKKRQENETNPKGFDTSGSEGISAPSFCFLAVFSFNFIFSCQFVCVWSIGKYLA
jgi:hypothetical protein